MLQKINRWLLGLFSNSDVNKLLLVAAFASGVLWLFIGELAPLLGAVLMAYVLDGAVSEAMERLKVRRAAAVAIVIIGAVVITVLTAYTLPGFLLQLRELEDRLPETVASLQVLIKDINQYLPAEAAIDDTAIAEQAKQIATASAGYLADNLFAYAGNVVTLFVYMVLFPLLVFFMLRDKLVIADYIRRFMPESPIFAELWQQVDEQFGSYIRGKVIESVLVGASMWIVFLLLRVDYALALSIMVGLSVFVPFVGAVVVTFPIVLFAFLQFGWSTDFAWVVFAYSVIQLVDAQVIVPLLFSEVIKIHPVALFSALIFFGNLWGIWGVFFAIPLAALIKCTIRVIARHHSPPPPAPSGGDA